LALYEQVKENATLRYRRRREATARAPFRDYGATSNQKAYLSAFMPQVAAVQKKTLKQLLFELSETHLEELERKGILPKSK